MATRAGVEKKKREATRKQIEVGDGSAGKIPRELREKLKKAKAAKGCTFCFLLDSSLSDPDFES